MKKSHPTFRALASFAFIVVLTTVAQAQATRTWVAGNGNDANPCTHALPCQTFAAAILQTAAGGEINAKNAGDFGPVTIDKSITIDGGGTFASINAGSGLTGVRIDDFGSATPNTAVVTLRNLSINGSGTTLGAYGVFFYYGKTLNIENCQIFNFSWAGLQIWFWPALGGNVNIKNTSIFNATRGVMAAGTSGFVTVSLNGCNIEQNTTAGVSLTIGAYVSIRNSVIQFNGIGVWLSLSDNTVNIVDSQINHNTTGLSVGATTTATIGSSTFLSNVTNFSNSGTIRTFGNNQTETDPIPGTVIDLGLR